MSRGLGSKQITVLSYLLDRHGTAAPAPVPDRELRARTKVQESSLSGLAYLEFVRAHRTPDGDVYWTLTREGLGHPTLVRITRPDAREAYARELDDAGM